MTRRAAALFLGLFVLAAAPAAAQQAKPRVVGGTAAQPGQYRYVAHVELGGIAECTGTLVAPSWVLTAAHCGSLTSEFIASPLAFPPALISVTLGTTRTDGTGGERPTVSNVIVHEGHLGLTNANDVALLQLAAPVADIAPLHVARGDEGGLWSAGTLATIAGFGVTSESSSTPPDTMQVAQVPIVQDSTCASAYPGEFEPASMLCAGFPEGGKDTCQGDSGGPLIVPTPAGGERLVGVTSFGDGCARPNKPGVYARIAGDALRGWLEREAPDAIAPAAVATSPASAGSPPAAGSPASPSATSPAPATASTQTKASTSKARAKKKAQTRKKALAKKRALAKKKALARKKALAKKKARAKKKRSATARNA